jgi:FkbM family methyltransferase
MISYAQNREDVLLQRIFKEREQGFYVDVGAFDPTVGSVTKHFYDKGWRGINLEPGLVFERLRAERPGDVNLNVAVSDRSGLVTYYEHPADPGTSTLAPDLDPALAHCREGRAARCVEAITLREVFERFQPTEIDFLKIDVEGHERQVLLGNDWARFRPRVLVIEATLPYSNTPCHERWEDVVLQAGYRFAHFDGLNRYYVRREDAALLERFTAPVNVLDQYVPEETVRYFTEAGQLRTELEEVRTRLEGREAEWAKSRTEADRLSSDLLRIDAIARQSEADRSRLQGEANRLQVALEQAGSRVQEHEAECRRLAAEVSRLTETLAQQTETLGQRELECHRLREAVQEALRRQDTDHCLCQSTPAPPPAERPAWLAGTRQRVARARDRLRQLTAALALTRAAGQRALAAVGARAAPRTWPTSFGNAMRNVAKACLRPFYRLAKALCRPLAWRLREFILKPVLLELHALPAFTIQLRLSRDEFTQGLARLQEQQNAIQAQGQQLAHVLGQVREGQGHVLSQFASQQGIIRETDRMVLALLKTAQLGPCEEPAEAAPRLYRECENL